MKTYIAATYTTHLYLSPNLSLSTCLWCRAAAWRVTAVFQRSMQSSFVRSAPKILSTSSRSRRRTSSGDTGEGGVKHKTQECTHIFVPQGCLLLSLCLLSFISTCLSVYLSLCRHYCVNIPESLPKLLLSVKWNSRDEVSQVPNTVRLSD